MWAAICVFIVCLTALLMFSRYLDFVESMQETECIETFESQLDSMTNEMTEYKKRVDALTLKVGFKL
jgi:peptidoglycan hydrolase CwlO-like protein